MSPRILRSVKGVAFLGGVLLAAAPALGGEHVRAGRQAPAPSQPAPMPVGRVVSPVTISLVPLAPTRSASEPAYVNLRGPDGQVRRFPVEGGTAELAGRVVVLRPGDSLTIFWMPRK